MPRGNNMPPSLALIHAMILAEEKAGKTTWLLEAAEAGFNVLLLDGDVAQQRINDLSPGAKSRVFYMNVQDELVGRVNPKMIQIVADFFVSTTFLWNDTKQAMYSRVSDPHDPESGACLDEVWVIKPGKLDHTWVLGVDSWSTLSYSAMLAKAESENVDIADIEKAERNIYAGAGNRLTNIAHTQMKAPCHTIFTGHPSQYEKRMSQAGKTVKEASRENDMIVEWTKLVPKSSSNAHGYSIGSKFSDIGWIDVTRTGKREMNFLKSPERTSGGSLNSKGDPKTDHSFASLVRRIGGTVPDGTQGTGDGLTIWEPGTYIPATAAKKATAAASRSPASDSLTPTGTAATPTKVQGIGGLGGLLKK